MWWRTSTFVALSWWTCAVSAACSISTVAVTFGAYQPRVTAPTDADGVVAVTCDSNVVYSIRLDAGGNSKGLYTQRAMVEPAKGGLLYYNLYLDPAHTQIWGDGAAGTMAASGSGVGTPQLLYVYGRIPPRQNVSIGTYSDTVTVSVDW